MDKEKQIGVILSYLNHKMSVMNQSETDKVKNILGRSALATAAQPHYGPTQDVKGCKTSNTWNVARTYVAQRVQSYQSKPQSNSTKSRYNK